MTSTKELEKTLPRKAPNTERHREVLGGLGRYKFQIYSTVSPALDGEALERLERDINSAAEPEGTGSSVLSPAARSGEHAGRPLRDVYEYHLRARDAGEDADEKSTVHPLYFVVADKADWKREGLLAVHLDCRYDEEQDRVGVGRCGVDWADSWGVNLDVVNMDWMDLKQAEHEEWGGDDPYADEDEDGDDDDERDAKAGEDKKADE
ncbi:hypothetical protein DL765_004591 [Monosporascus sp. GIB2]|nr:hypothetical protein DL765_004591 [Monosporascus sp. GIB2]